MSMPDPAALYAACEATWPPCTRRELGPVTLRDGRGGGKRVSAATAKGVLSREDLAAAEDAMRKAHQRPLFMIREGEDALDAQLAKEGYDLIDPVTIHLAPARALTNRPIPRTTAFPVWEPLQIMREIWNAGGIGPMRQEVMDRAPMPKTAILGRCADRPAGAAFVALHGNIAMVHAIEVSEPHRKRGMGGWLMRAAAIWARGEGAAHVAVLCTEDNMAARALYRSLRMQEAAGYHYRMRNDPQEAG